MENIISSKEAQNHFGDLMNKAIREPVIIQKYGKPSAVMISHEAYEKFIMFEDLYWQLQAKSAGENGFLSVEESNKFLNSILNG